MKLLLDTNILVLLITDPQERYLIDRLESLIQSEQFELLVPDTLKSEWEQKKEHVFQKTEREIAEMKKYNNQVIDSQAQDELRILKEKAEQIDALINASIAIPLTDAVKIKTADRKRDNLPPFRVANNRSFNDGLIYFSAIEFLKSNNIPEYCFITRDRDFSDPNVKDKLDASLIEDDLEVYFNPSLEKQIRILHGLGKIKDESKASDAGSRITIEVVRRKKMNFLDYLYEVLLVCQRKMRMVPPHIFCKIEPFRIPNSRYYYTEYSQYVLYTNNDELIEIFKNVDIDEVQFKNEETFANSEDNIKKLKYIIEVFHRQFIFSIKKVSSNESVNVRPKRLIVCNCPRCLYTRLELTKLVAEDYSSDDTMKLAFVHFQLGFFEKSFKEYFACYEKAKQEKNKILIYQLQYMLTWVGFFLKTEKDTELKAMVDRVNKFNNEKDFFSFASGDDLDREIARFYYDGKILKWFDGEINETLEKIRAHYQSQLGASFSSNSHYRILSTDFSVFAEFTSANCLPYTKYSDFVQICNYYTEGTFLSYGLNEFQPSRLTRFGEYELAKLFRYGNPDQISKLYHKTIKKRIKHETVDEPFEPLAITFLANGKQLALELNEKAWEGNQLLYSMYWNLLVLLSIIDFSEEFILKCYNLLIPFLEVLPRREISRLNHLGLFIRRNGKTLGMQRLKELFDLCLNHADLHNESVFDAFAGLAGKGHFELISGEQVYEKMMSYFGEKCPKCNEYHHNIIYDAYSLLNGEYRKKLTDKMRRNLSVNFDFDVYYIAAIYEIINYQDFFEKSMSLFQKPGEKLPQPFANMDGPVTFSELSNFMNIVFKNDVELPEDFILKMKGISDYYDWLLDMKGFNYDNFNPLWINYYSTRYYLKRIFSFEIVREKVQIYLRTNHQPTLAYYYTQYVNGGEVTVSEL
jgi:hypothetical protein